MKNIDKEKIKQIILSHSIKPNQYIVIILHNRGYKCSIFNRYTGDIHYAGNVYIYSSEVLRIPSYKCPKFTQIDCVNNSPVFIVNEDNQQRKSKKLESFKFTLNTIKDIILDIIDYLAKIF